MKGTCKCGEEAKVREKHMDESRRWWKHAAKHRETAMKKSRFDLLMCVSVIIWLLGDTGCTLKKKKKKLMQH